MQTMTLALKGGNKRDKIRHVVIKPDVFVSNNQNKPKNYYKQSKNKMSRILLFIVEVKFASFILSSSLYHQKGNKVMGNIKPQYGVNIERKGNG